MKKLIAGVLGAAALALPAAPASASEIPPPAGTKPCPAPYTHGFILWVNTGPTGYHEEWFCIARGPGTATADEPDAWWGRKPCQWGEIGTVIWHDTPATEYQEIDLCIPRIYPGPGI
jgi:hypothetical protein